VELGWDPPRGGLLLPVGGTFTVTLRAPADWPPGTIDLHFTGDGTPITWEAAIDGPTAVWEQTVAEVTEVLDSGYGAVALRATPTDGEPAIWYRLAVRPV
jgi:hypothetical protein